MAQIKFPFFGGMVPRRDEQHLQAGDAVRATNTDLDSGELRPIIAPQLAHVFPRAGAADFVAPKPVDPSIPNPDPPEPVDCVPVEIVTPPQDYRAQFIPEQITFSVVLNTDASLPVVIRWYVDDILQSGQTGTTLTVTPAQLQNEYNNGELVLSPNIPVLTRAYGVVKIEVSNPCGFDTARAVVSLEDAYACDALEIFFSTTYEAVWWEVYARAATKAEHAYPFGAGAPYRRYFDAPLTLTTNWSSNNTDSVVANFSLEVPQPIDPCIAPGDADAVIRREVLFDRPPSGSPPLMIGDAKDTSVVAIVRPTPTFDGIFFHWEDRFQVVDTTNNQLAVVNMGVQASGELIGSNYVYSLTVGGNPNEVASVAIPAAELLDTIGPEYKPLVVNVVAPPAFTLEYESRAPYRGIWHVKANMSAYFNYGNAIQLSVSGSFSVAQWYDYGEVVDRYVDLNYGTTYSFFRARCYVAAVGQIKGHKTVVMDDVIRAFDQNGKRYNP